MEVKNECEKMLSKLEKIVKEVKVLDINALELYNLALSYFQDAKYFYDNKNYLKCFECLVIVWAYLDACLHFKFIEVPKEYLDYFTVNY